MAKTPSEVLKKTKAPDTKKDGDKDDKAPRKNALLSYIAKCKDGMKK